MNRCASSQPPADSSLLYNPAALPQASGDDDSVVGEPVCAALHFAAVAGAGGPAQPRAAHRPGAGAQLCTGTFVTVSQPKTLVDLLAVAFGCKECSSAQ